VFALAGIWEAVLLFDEADVFLEARGEGDNDLRRNAMVSVLLRVLEYYDGILILTTNRMRSLDIAVQSRIHLAIKFTELAPYQKVSIFTSFLDQLANKNHVEDYDEIKDWVAEEGKRLDFNGRQIRNVISTALGIALAGNRKMLRKDLAVIARQTDNFKRELSAQEAIYRDRQINPRT
jgi:SpoVK/Ycf46/Vps4 family AAA+-type ATPase